MSLHKIFLQLVEPGSHQTTLNGISSAEQALCLLKILSESQNKRSLLVICPDMDALETLQQDFSTLLQAFQRQQSPGLIALLQNPTQALSSLGVLTLPDWETIPNSSVFPSISVRQARVKVLALLALNPKQQKIVFATSVSCLQRVSSPQALIEATLTLREKDSISTPKFTQTLLEMGYEPVDLVEDLGTYSIRGDVIDVFPSHLDQPIRIVRFGDEIESIQYFDPIFQRSTPVKLPEVVIPPAREVVLSSSKKRELKAALKLFADDLGFPRPRRELLTDQLERGLYPEYADLYLPFLESHSFLDFLPGAGVVSLEPTKQLAALNLFEQEYLRFQEGAQTGRALTPSFELLYGSALNNLKSLQQSSSLVFDQTRIQTQALGKPIPILAQEFQSITLFCSSKNHLDRVLYLKAQPTWPKNVTVLEENAQATLSSSISDPDLGILLLADHDYFGKKLSKPTKTSKKALKDSIQSLSDLEPGDIAIHIMHGKCRYIGLARLDIFGAPTDFLTLEFLGKDRLYLPVYRLECLQKLSGPDADASLDKLGGTQFEKTKDLVRAAVKKLAVDLIQLYAKRATVPGLPILAPDGMMQEFASRFAFQETPDQEKAIEQTLEDLASGRIMDRLICGDVGFGKTEVAMRAAFATVMAGYQVAILVPTTLLASQHESSFLSRFENYPLRIESLSRFKSPSAQKKTLQALQEGKIDILIGTHRLLSKDIQFKKLGLLVVDEEHRFGVDHKERIKEIKANSHVLTLSATPIPRTLHMALSGLREVTLISTPPTTRLPVKTYVASSGNDLDGSEELIKGAIDKELARNGQIFVVHNRVQDIQAFATRLGKLAPQAKIAYAHGQMNETQLEKILSQFIAHEFDILVTTTIIESGIDIPNCNTLIINRADTFGLAQLYQIRGRVGRGDRRAYAYLLVPNLNTLTHDAKKRLEVIQRFVELGSGFSIASHDLEIRGGGNLLGPEQSGHVHAVGFDLYLELLEEAIQQLKGKQSSIDDRSRQPEIRTQFPAFLPEEFVPDLHQRIHWYRKISVANTPGEFDLLAEELKDRYGRLPEACENLLWIAKLKQLMARFEVDLLTVGAESISMTASRSTKIIPFKILSRAAAHPTVYQLTPDSRLIVKNKAKDPSHVYFFLEQLLTEIS